MAFYCNGKKDTCNCGILCADCEYFDNSGGLKFQTNADRIRAMSDEELCDFIMDAPAIPCDEKMSAMMKKNECSDCQKCVMEWLKQPAED